MPRNSKEDSNEKTDQYGSDPAFGFPMLLSVEPVSSAVIVSSGLADNPEPKDEDPETDVICGMPQHAQYVVMATGAVVQKRNAGSSPETVLD